MVPSITRRSFVTSLATAPLILRTSLAQGSPRPAPSDRISIGIIGCGKITRDYHLPELLAQSDTQVIAVCDVDTLRRDAARERVHHHYSTAKQTYKGCDTYRDFRELIARDDLDAVCIATPDHWHAIPLIAACQARKDVYCEKPLTLTILEAQQCVAAARKYQRVVQTGSQQRSNVFGPFREAVERIQCGRLGKIHRVTIGVGGPSKFCDLPEERIEAGLDWDLWLGPAPDRPYHSVLSPRGVHDHFPNWRSYREYSGGGHTDMGAHHYDIAMWALELDDTGPAKIVPPADPAAESGVRYTFANGIEFEHGGPGGCVFHGERGTLHIDRGVLESEPAEIAAAPLSANEIHLPVTPGHHRNWLDCIRTRESPVADVEKGARTVSLIHLGNLAYWLRRPLQWQPESWQFTDPADNQWLDCARRDPWKLPEL